MAYVGAMLSRVGEVLASCEAGQAMLRGADRMLWVIEKAAQWAVQPPIDEYVEPGSTSQLTRPLPWVFFLILLFVMRIWREAYNIAAILLGLNEVGPSQIVKFIQSKRRHLRAVKYQGMRTIRSRGRDNRGSAQWLSRMLHAVQSTACLVATTQGDQENEVVVVKMVGGKKTRSERQYENQSSDGGDEDEVYKQFLYDEQTNSGTEDPDFTITDKPSASETSTTSIESADTQNSDYLSGESTPNKENKSPQENQQSNLTNVLVENNDKVSNTVSPECVVMNGPVKTKLPTPKDSAKQILESERRRSVENYNGNESKKENEKETEANKASSKRSRNSPRKSRIANGSPKKISPLKHKSSELPVMKVTTTEESDCEHLQFKG